MRLACAALAATLAAAASASTSEPNVISKVELREEGGAVVLTIQGSRPPSFTTFATERPARFVIDVAGGELRAPAAELARDAGPVAGVRAEQLAGTSTARVAVALRGALEGAEVRTKENALVVTFAGEARPVLAATTGSEPEGASPTSTRAPTPTPTPTATATETKTEELAARTGASHLAARDVPAPEDRTQPAQSVLEFGFRQLAERSRVYVRTGGAPRFALEERGETLVVLRLDHARVARRNDARPLDTSFFPTAVARITPRRDGAEYVLEIALREKVAYQQHVEGDLLAVDFELPAAPAAAR